MILPSSISMTWTALTVARRFDGGNSWPSGVCVGPVCVPSQVSSIATVSFIEVGPLTLAWHGITIAIGVLVGGLAAFRYARERGLNAEPLYPIAMLLVVGSPVRMCRWNAYFGHPLVIDELLYRTQHGLIDESLHSRMGAETTNGDGFGLGWYNTDDRTSPGRYRSVAPAWNDANLRDLAAHIESPLFLAHIRAAIGSPVQQTNCHPFRHGRWLFVHNGMINGFAEIHRELALAVDPSLFRAIGGSTDSETLFYLALTLGLEEDPIGGLERAVGLIEATGREHGVESPMQGTFGLSDGERLWAVRYSSEHRSRTLFVSQDVRALKELHPGNPRLQRMTDEDRVVVSEPLSDLSEVWLEVPESSALVIQDGPDERKPFRPQHP